MMIFLLGCYIAILALFVWLKFVPLNLFWKLSPLIVLLVLNIALFIPMGWGAPQGEALVVRQSVAIVPEVAGEVADVPVSPNTALKAGDVLFRIDTLPFEAQLKGLEAQFKFQELRLAQMKQLHSTGTGRAFDVEQREAEVEELRAKIDAAKWNLDKTTVKAPSDGYVTNVALRKGARVANLPLAPVMAFIDTSDTIIGVEIAQNYARYIRPGQTVELTFKFFPGTIYTGKVEAVLQAVASGQTQVSGAAVAPKGVLATPFVVRVKLDDPEIAKLLPAGSTGDAAIFTDHVKVAHVIRRVLLRQIAIINYINPF
jgi:RND family efflux transporter MFP subunit